MVQVSLGGSPGAGELLLSLGLEAQPSTRHGHGSGSRGGCAGWSECGVESFPPRTLVPNIPPSQHCFDPMRFGLCHPPQQ